LLDRKGKVYITAERELEPEFEPYRIKLDPSFIHHALAFANLYVGDSQTMAAEAAVLGTPSIRFNDFVGEIGYIEELEHNFGLSYGVRSGDPDKLFELVEKFTQEGSRETWAGRRAMMLRQRTDFAAFLTSLIESYPARGRDLRSD